MYSVAILGEERAIRGETKGRFMRRKYNGNYDKRALLMNGSGRVDEMPFIPLLLLWFAFTTRNSCAYLGTEEDTQLLFVSALRGNDTASCGTVLSPCRSISVRECCRCLVEEEEASFNA